MKGKKKKKGFISVFITFCNQVGWLLVFLESSKVTMNYTNVLEGYRGKI